MEKVLFHPRRGQEHRGRLQGPVAAEPQVKVNPMEINFLVGGEAGQGVQTVGFVLAKVMSRGGLHVFADQDYESRIRGGHNFFRVRAGDTPVGALSEKVDILIALNKETLDLHRSEVKADGLALFDRG